MLSRLTLLLLFCVSMLQSMAQASQPSCGQQEVMQRFYATHPEYASINQQVERVLAQRTRALRAGTLRVQQPTAPVSLPVVVHIIHNNGTENISDAQVLQGIQHLNEAFANTGFYDPSDGVNTQIQFCMAQRDPANNATNGITRDLSPYTVMGGATYYADDQQVKNINRWNPLCYINIWLVKSIPTSVVGYAYLPSAHGTSVDGIIIEAGYFGSSYSNDVVAAHEMGHYLGLYHTFEGGCTNNDCNSDGDHVCDTPPDQSTAGISCTSSANSCSTDVLSGFSTDQPDLTQDYMDYGNFNCMKVFTADQSDRMNWFIQNVRKSLLACKSCMNPCPAPVTADFVWPAAPFVAGTTYTFTNTSINAASFDWYVNGVMVSNTSNLTISFPLVGSYTIKMVAHSGNVLCDDAVKVTSLSAVCGINAGFSKSAGTAPAGSAISFSNLSTGADSYEWYVNGQLQSNTLNFSYVTATGGDYIIKLVSKNTATNCSAEYTDTVHYTCSVVTDFIPQNAVSLINSPVTFTSTGSGGSSFQWLINGVPAGSGSSLTYSFTAVGAYQVQLLTGNGSCAATKTTIEYINDKCGHAQFQFQKSYAVGANSAALDIYATADAGSVLVDRVISPEGITSPTILKLDAAGNKEWMYDYGNGSSAIFRKVKQTTDGGYIAIGTTGVAGSQAGALLIVKTTASGTPQWRKELSVKNVNNADGADIIQSFDGNYYFTGFIVTGTAVSTSQDIITGKLDAGGSLVWLSGYDAHSTEAGTGLADDNNHIVVTGNKSSQGVNSGFLLLLNKADGSPVWGRSYSSTDENFRAVQVATDGYFVDALRKNIVNSTFTDHVYIKTDFTGKISYSNYIQPFGISKETGGAAARIKSNGHILSQTSGMFGGTYVDFIVQEIDPATGVVWSKKYNRAATWLYGITLSANNIWLAGNSIEPTGTPLQTFVMKADTLGNTGNCAADAVTIDLLRATYNSSAVDFRQTTLAASVALQGRFTPLDPIVNSHCLYVQCDDPPPVDTCLLCTSLKLEGADTVCSVSSTVTYSIIRSAGCTSPGQWHLSDPASGVITVLNDSTATVLFSKAGKHTIYANLQTSCQTGSDSIQVLVVTSPATIDLGPDVTLCNFSTYKMNAGSGFASYVWNDGSTDSVLTAFNPGTYSVTAKDFCGNSYTDEIILSAGAVIPFDLGPDRKKCDNDTLTITAPGTFSTYSWSADYAISSTTSQTVQVWPAKDTTYTVLAQIANGCTVLDTIRILVDHAPGMQIGNDTSFCAGDSLQLFAPTGFSQYYWQDGTTGDHYTIYQRGTYWLQATALNGCISRDSVTVKELYPLPVKFADVEAAICEGEDAELKAIGNWSSYLWFNHSTSSSVTIHSPGVYWLQVTSSKGCSARDSITVMANPACQIGIWFPNAFTPDRNGYNDNYKPIVKGSPKKFRLSIYNRFGEKVFETTDYKTGWNGIYKGIRQPQGGFVWYCIYQFANAETRMEKGTILLLR